MFLSYSYKGGPGYDKETHKTYYRYIIVDSDFGEIADIGCLPGMTACISAELGNAVIDTYEKRGLPVIKNLIKAFIYLNKLNSNYVLGQFHIKNIIDLNKYYNNVKFSKYEKEIEKYMILL